MPSYNAVVTQLIEPLVDFCLTCLLIPLSLECVSGSESVLQNFLFLL